MRDGADGKHSPAQAEEREREESRRLRDLERGEMSEKRRTELLLRQRLAAAMEEKRLHLAHVTWLEHHSRVAAFLVTGATPPLLFLPTSHNASTQAALEARRAACAAEVERAEARLAEALLRAKAEAAEREAGLTEGPGRSTRGAPSEADAAAVEEGGAGDESMEPGEVPQPAALQPEEAEPANDQEIEDAAAANPAGLEAILGGGDA